MNFGQYLPKCPETPKIDRNNPKFFQSGIGTPWTKFLKSPLSYPTKKLKHIKNLKKLKKKQLLHDRIIFFRLKYK